MCDHVFVFLRTIQNVDNCNYQLHWEQTDIFFCEKCLEQKNVYKHEYSRDKPDWWANLKNQ